MVRLGCATVALLSLFSCGQEKFNNSSSYAETARAYFESNATSLCYPNTSSSDAIGMDNTIFPVWSKASVTKDDDGCILVEAPLGGSQKLVGCVYEAVDGQILRHPALASSALVFVFHNEIVAEMFIQTTIDQCRFGSFEGAIRVNNGIRVVLESDLDGTLLHNHIIPGNSTATAFGYKIGVSQLTKGGGEDGPEGEWLQTCWVCGTQYYIYEGHSCNDVGAKEDDYWPYRSNDLCPSCGEEMENCVCSDISICPICSHPTEFCVCDPEEFSTNNGWGGSGICSDCRNPKDQCTCWYCPICKENAKHCTCFCAICWAAMKDCRCNLPPEK